MSTFEDIRTAIRKATGIEPRGQATPVGGGCINQAFRLGEFFVKTNHPEEADLFAAERDGLRALAEQEVIRVPAVVCSGRTGNHSYLVLEHLPLGPTTAASEQELGRQLSRLHSRTAESFGWPRDNYIGSTPQPNTWTISWSVFFRDRRLQPLLAKLAAAGARFRGADRLLDQLDRFFPEQQPQPSLLHGDLWGGNAAALPDGTPVLFDPAVYFGDREADLAMTRLFGGFGPNFYDAYQEAWPLDPGAESRLELYNLYHILNHALLFGGSYARQAEGMIGRLLARI